jgi:hypothetical protein
VAEWDDEIEDAGARILWVLEQGPLLGRGTAANCRDFMDGHGSDRGWCVGDDETLPEPDVFDDSPFSVGRGFDIIVTRHDMKIVYSTSHGTPQGNENLTGADILDAVEAAVEDLPLVTD